MWGGGGPGIPHQKRIKLIRHDSQRIGFKGIGDLSYSSSGGKRLPLGEGEGA